MPFLTDIEVDKHQEIITTKSNLRSPYLRRSLSNNQRFLRGVIFSTTRKVSMVELLEVADAELTRLKSCGIDHVNPAWRLSLIHI